MWCDTRKRMAGGTGIFFAVLGFAVLIGGYAKASSTWKDNNCCEDGVNCALICELGCHDSTETVFEANDCCYSYEGSSPDTLIFLYAAGAFGAVLITMVTLELGDRICCECCQKFSAVILALVNAVGMVFIVVLAMVIAQKDETTDTTGCPDENDLSLLGLEGVYFAATIILGLSVACSIVVTFIECCCDDSGKDATGEEHPTVAP